nr:amidase family protein [Burkholderia cepacia]
MRGAVGDCDALSRGRIVTQQLWQLSAIEIAKRVRHREVSAREVADATLARLDAVNPAINAVVEHRPDDVRRQADEVDRAIARGDDPGPLAGVPR